MANYYTEFSFTYPVETLEQRAWALNLIGAVREYEYDTIPESSPYYKYVHDLSEINHGEIYLCLQVETGLYGNKHVVHIMSDDAGDAEHAVWLVWSLMDKFQHKDAIVFEWASTCSAPRVDSFSGGAVLITPDDVKWYIPYNFYRKDLERYERGFLGYHTWRVRKFIARWRTKWSYVTRRYRNGKATLYA